MLILLSLFRHVNTLVIISIPTVQSFQGFFQHFLQFAMHALAIACARMSLASFKPDLAISWCLSTWRSAAIKCDVEEPKKCQTAQKNKTECLFPWIGSSCFPENIQNKVPGLHAGHVRRPLEVDISDFYRICSLTYKWEYCICCACKHQRTVWIRKWTIIWVCWACELSHS